jgi:hypothetical protein
MRLPTRHGRRTWLAALLAVALALSAGAEDAIPRQQLALVLDNGAAFVASRQLDDGSFGAVQPHLQTALATLALLSLRQPGQAAHDEQIVKAAGYLVQAANASGDLGDDAFPVESHAAALTALIAALPLIDDAALHKQASEIVYRGLRLLQRMQDRTSGTASRGGWKMDGFKGRDNDRRATAWALLAYQTADLYGMDPGQANLDRACAFMIGAFKETSDQADQIGGFSVEADGLAVASISAMGAFTMAVVRPDPARLPTTLAWLDRNPPLWSGPNYFYTNFFRIRALRFGDPTGDRYRRALRHLILQIKDNQQANGGVDLPPGNAQNTVAMGPVFSTAMALLILNLDDSRLACDEDWRVRPLVEAPPTHQP